jgi:hypothetical protein
MTSQFVISGGDGPIMLEFGKRVFHQMSGLVKLPVEPLVSLYRLSYIAAINEDTLQKFKQIGGCPSNCGRIPAIWKLLVRQLVRVVPAYLE